MFRFFGGVPRLVMPDNLKSGVHKASFYDPEINRSYPPGSSATKVVQNKQLIGPISRASAGPSSNISGGTSPTGAHKWGGMAETELNGLTALPTATGWIARATYARCVKKGIKADTLLRKAGLSPLQIDHSELRIPVRCQIKFVDLAARALSDELLGFHLAKTAELREIGLLYYVMASSELLGDALQSCARYSAISNEGVRFSYRADRDARIDFNYAGPRHYPDRHQIEFFMITVVRLCRQLTGHNLLPQRTTLTRPTDVSNKMREYFGCRVVFGGIVDRMIFPKAIRRLPIRVDPYLNVLLERYCDEVRAARAEPTARRR